MTQKGKTYNTVRGYLFAMVSKPSSIDTNKMDQRVKTPEGEDVSVANKAISKIIQMQCEAVSQQSNAEKKLQLHLKKKVGQNRSEIVTGKKIILCILSYFDLLSAQFFKPNQKTENLAGTVARPETQLLFAVNTD